MNKPEYAFAEVVVWRQRYTVVSDGETTRVCSYTQDVTDQRDHAVIAMILKEAIANVTRKHIDEIDEAQEAAEKMQQAHLEEERKEQRKKEEELRMGLQKMDEAMQKRLAEAAARDHQRIQGDTV